MTLDTNGLLNGAPHAMHIHAGGRGHLPAGIGRAPAQRAPVDQHDRTGSSFYGPPQVSLTSTGDTSPKSIVDFSRYPHDRDIRYTRTITVPPGVAAAIRAGNAVIVVHGIDYNHNGIYDNVLDRSELNKQPARGGDGAGTVRPARPDEERLRAWSRGLRATTYAVVLHRTRRRCAVAGSERSRCSATSSGSTPRSSAITASPAAGTADLIARPRHRETTIVAFIHGWIVQ